MPLSLLNVINTSDPAAVLRYQNANPFMGKRILALYGEIDKMIPQHLSQEFLDLLDVGHNGAKLYKSFPDVAHTCTEEMVEEMSQFIWRELVEKLQRKNYSKSFL